MSHRSIPTWAVPSWARRAARFAISADARWDVAYEWRRRFRTEPALPEGEIRNVVLLCYGNICRSAFAGPALAALRPDLAVRDAGFEAREGKPAEPGAIRAARKYGVALEDHGAHRLDAGDVAWADLILGMEGHHVGFLARHWPIARSKTRVLGHFLNAPPYAISDPWGRDDGVFDQTFERIRLALDRLSERLPVLGS